LKQQQLKYSAPAGHTFIATRHKYSRFERHRQFYAAE
jgi:hypothetical protein